MSDNNHNNARSFGQCLDKDDFVNAAKYLSKDCAYLIGPRVLHGPTEIVGDYESNMIEGRKKLDELVWGACEIEPLNDSQFYVHFTDFLGHKGRNYTHRCKQKLTFNEAGLIHRIEHIDDADESARLRAWYNSVGL